MAEQDPVSMQAGIVWTPFEDVSKNLKISSWSDHLQVLIELLDSVNIVGYIYKLVQQEAADSDFEASAVELRLGCFRVAETSVLQESLQKALQDLAQCLRSSHAT